MDLNQKLAARRAELAKEEERQRIEAAALRQAQEAAQREEAEVAAREAAEAKNAAEQLQLPRQTTPVKVVSIEDEMAVLGQAVERVTKLQMALLCMMAVLSLLSLTQDLTKALLWAVGALAYLFLILYGYAVDIKKSSLKP